MIPLLLVLGAVYVYNQSTPTPSMQFGSTIPGYNPIDAILNERALNPPLPEPLYRIFTPGGQGSTPSGSAGGDVTGTFGSFSGPRIHLKP